MFYNPIQAPSFITSNPNISGSESPIEHFKKVLRVAQNLSELYDHQTTVQDLLEEEGENATIETRALSVVISKTLQQTCSWVRTHHFYLLLHLNKFQLQTVWSDHFNCSSAVEFKRAMVELQLWNAARFLRYSLTKFPNPSFSNNSPQKCNWTKCNIANNSSVFNYTLSALRC